MKDDADRVWNEAADDARPRPRELLRAELELRRSYRASPKKLATAVDGLEPRAKSARVRNAYVLVAAAALLVTLLVGVWPARRKTDPPQPALASKPGEQAAEQPRPVLVVPNRWTTALRTAGDPGSTPGKRLEAASFLDDSLYEIAEATRALLTEEVIAHGVRAARQEWARALEEGATVAPLDWEGDPATLLKVLCDVTLLTTERERALALMHPQVIAGIRQLRDFVPFDEESRTLLQGMSERLRAKLQ